MLRSKMYTLLVSLLLISCSASGQYKVEMDQFSEGISDSTALLVDVRTPEEFATARIPGAVNIDIKSEDFDSNVADIDRSTPMYLYCRSGRRSNTAAIKLKEMGFEYIYDLEGGILSWTENGNTADSSVLEVTH